MLAESKSKDLVWVIPTTLYHDERLQAIFSELQERLKTRIMSKNVSAIGANERVLIPCINSSKPYNDVAVALDRAALGILAIKFPINDIYVIDIYIIDIVVFDKLFIINKII